MTETPPKPPEPSPARPRPDTAAAPARAGEAARATAPPPAGPRPAVAPVAGAVPPPGRQQISEAARPAPPPGSRVLPALYFLGFAILAGAIAWLWQNPPQPPESAPGALLQRLDAAEARLARLETRPEPRPAPAFDPAPLLARIAALEARPAGASALLDQPSPVDLAPIESRIAALEARPTVSPADTALGERVSRIARVQAAAAALEAGHRLGALPDAPPALQRFADADPPTEPALRLAFPSAARAALVASRPIDPNLPWLSRIWGRLQELITIRQGERVLVGDPAAGVVAAAQRALDAGDLAGAVAALSRLNPPAAQAMAGWIDQAKALLEARAALADMAARAAASPTAAHG